MRMLRVLEGVVARRLLITYRVDPEVAARILPPPLEPLVYAGAAIAGISLIRIAELRPRGLTPIAGLTIENLSHRFAVTTRDDGGERRPGVLILRRDTESRLVATLGGPLFSGSHHRARFEVEEDERRLRLAVKSDDSSADVEVEVDWAAAFTPSRTFTTLEEAKCFYQECEHGFQGGARPGEIAAVRLKGLPWRAEAVRLKCARSRYFENEKLFPEGAVELDSAIAMRSLPHEWVEVKEVPEILEEPLLPQMA